MASSEQHQLDLLNPPESETVSKKGTKIQNPQDLPEECAASTESGAEIVLPDVSAGDDIESSIGSRFRREREKRGWSCEEVGSKLKLQAGLIRRIEQDDYNGIAHAVYLRGYLTSYARLLDLPVVLADRAVADRSEPAPLVSTGTVSRSRYLIDRYSVSATYLILTGLVIGPAVWLATHGGLEQNLARTVMLDGQSSTIETAIPAGPAPEQGITADSAGQGDSSIDAPNANTIAAATPATAVAAADAPPIVASMAPFATAPAAQAPVPAQPEATATNGRHTLTLKLSQASWVEITDVDGEKLEYGLLPAGVERKYASDGVISLRIGNAQGAEVIADGKVIDLAPFQRANVAHLKVFAEGSLATRADS